VTIAKKLKNSSCGCMGAWVRNPKNQLYSARNAGYGSTEVDSKEKSEKISKQYSEFIDLQK